MWCPLLLGLAFRGSRTGTAMGSVSQKNADACENEYCDELLPKLDGAFAVAGR